MSHAPTIGVTPMSIPKKTTATEMLAGMFIIVLISFTVGALYFAKNLLMPLALAGMLTFLLSPAVGRLERWTGKVFAAVAAVLVLSIALGTLGWFLSSQMANLAMKLPNYKQNIVRKLNVIRLPQRFDARRLSQTIDDLRREIPIAQSPGSSPGNATIPSAPAQPPVPAATPTATLSSLQSITRPLLNGLGVWLFVMVLVVFMLVQRQDLRVRMIRLMGHGHASDARNAIEEASSRVLHYLTMQVAVNTTFGVLAATGLFFIGVPNAMLWGAMAAVLRFVPYVGVWVAAAFPVLQAFAVLPDWTSLLLVLGLFGVLEFSVGNFLEPCLYGSRTGVSSLALIVAAGFWFWLWGPMGLALSTPLTVCVVVIGRHVPRLGFFHTLMANEETPFPRRFGRRRKPAADAPRTPVSP